MIIGPEFWPIKRLFLNNDRVVYGCRTTTDAAEDDVSNDVMDAEEYDVVGRYARYNEVT